MFTVLVVVPIVVYALLKIFLFRSRYKFFSSNLKVKNDENYDIEYCANKDNYIEHSIIRQRNIVAIKDLMTADMKETTTKKEYNILPRPYGVKQGLCKHVTTTTHSDSINRNHNNVADVKSENDVSNQLLNSKPIVDLTVNKTIITYNSGNNVIDVKSQCQPSLCQHGLIASVALKDLRLDKSHNF